MGEHVVGVDLGGTQIRSALVNAEGSIIARDSALTRSEEGPDAVVDRILNSIASVISSTAEASIMGIGVGAPGPLNPWTGVVIEPPNLHGWHEIPLAHLIEEKFDLPTQLGKDANVAAIAENRFGAGRGSADMIYMTVSTGIGGGIITDGDLLLGSRGLAGEIGHHSVEANGPLCGCGHRGCLESLASGPAIARRTVEAIESGSDSLVVEMVGGDLAAISATTVSKAASMGDAVALEVIRSAGFYIGVGLTNLIHIFNPDVIVIGGGVTKIGEPLFEPIRETVRSHAMASLADGIEIVPAALGDDVGLIGAACLQLP